MYPDRKRSCGVITTCDAYCLGWLYLNVPRGHTIQKRGVLSIILIHWQNGTMIKKSNKNIVVLHYLYYYFCFLELFDFPFFVENQEIGFRQKKRKTFCLHFLLIEINNGHTLIGPNPIHALVFNFRDRYVALVLNLRPIDWCSTLFFLCWLQRDPMYNIGKQDWFHQKHWNQRVRHLHFTE